MNKQVAGSPKLDGLGRRRRTSCEKKEIQTQKTEVSPFCAFHKAVQCDGQCQTIHTEKNEMGNGQTKLENILIKIIK